MELMCSSYCTGYGWESSGEKGNADYYITGWQFLLASGRLSGQVASNVRSRHFKDRLIPPVFWQSALVDFGQNAYSGKREKTDHN